jgi:hypothetical protein
MKMKGPIVIFKKVALNFPPLEQGLGRQSGRLAPASRLREACTQRLSKSFGVFHLRASKKQKTSPGG